jgi:hypothetical protein
MSLAPFCVSRGNERGDRCGGAIRVARCEWRCGIIFNVKLDRLSSFFASDLSGDVECEVNA